MSEAFAIENLTHPFGQQTCGPQPDERRRANRRRIYETYWLTMSCVTANLSSFLVARLVDISPGGFGLCTLEPVAEGHEYAVAGKVKVDDQWLEVSGHARVAYCKPSEEDTYRVGLDASGVRCERIPRPS